MHSYLVQDTLIREGVNLNFTKAIFGLVISINNKLNHSFEK